MLVPSGSLDGMVIDVVCAAERRTEVTVEVV